MKQAAKATAIKWSLSFILLMITIAGVAQDSTSAGSTTSSTTTTTTTTMWYMRPWAWVLGALILITIIFLATGGGKNKTHVTQTGVVEEDSVELPDRDTI